MSLCIDRKSRLNVIKGTGPEDGERLFCATYLSVMTLEYMV